MREFWVKKKYELLSQKKVRTFKSKKYLLLSHKK